MSSDLQTQLTEAEKSFKRACEQIIHLNRRLDEMAKRYDKASRENHRSFRYSLRLRMAVSEGVRNMYYEYAANKADLISDLRYKVADGTTVRTVATATVSVPEVGLRTAAAIRNGNPELAEQTNHLERATREWQSRNGADGNTNRKTPKRLFQKRTLRPPKPRATSTVTLVTPSTSTASATRSSATQNMEVEEDSSVPLVEGSRVSQYDSSDIDSPSTSSGSGASVVSVSEGLVEGATELDQFFTSNGVENSESVQTGSASPDSASPDSCSSSP
ncbi:hypothetical protein ACOMHN_051719 [Nucella lapillus]